MNEIKQTEVDQYNLLKPLLSETYKEMQELSKKKPESVLNTFKVKLINRILQPANNLLKNEPTYEFLDLLDSDNLPTNSDVLIIIGQYLKAMDMFIRKYSDKYGKWNIE